MSDSTADLVTAAQKGDLGAFRALVERYWAMLVRLARSVIGEDEAEDAAQEALVVAWRKLHQLTEPHAFPRWVARIVLRHSLRRARRRPHTVPLEAAGDPGHAPGVESRVLVWEVLSHLAPRQRAVLHLTVVEGMADSEIGRALGISASSVRVHRLRARSRVSELLGGGKGNVPA